MRHCNVEYTHYNIKPIYIYTYAYILYETCVEDTPGALHLKPCIYSCISRDVYTHVSRGALHLKPCIYSCISTP